MYILIVGDPVDGFEYHGPFENQFEADKYAEAFYGDTYWWIIELTKPNYDRESI